MKTCIKCKEEKPFTEYNFNSKASDGYRGECKSCRRIAERERYAKNHKGEYRRYTKVHNNGNSKSLQTNPKGQKHCVKCNIFKTPSDFYKQSNTKDGLNSWCKACSREATKRNYYADPEKTKLLTAIKNIKCKDRYRVWYRRYVSTPEYKTKRTEKLMERYNTDVGFKLRMVLRSRVRMALFKTSSRKSYKTEELIGCDVESLKLYLERQFNGGMSWDNHREWHIDHIIPCASFDLTDPEQQKQCFHYTNLQPLWAFDNLSKGARIKEPVQMLIPL
jgi:hypothetical protein